MLIEIVTIFPLMFEGVFHYGMVQQAIKKGLLEIKTVDLRSFTKDRHRTVDDRPYGGGQGMVLKPEPLFRAVEACRREDSTPAHVILLDPQGARFDQDKANKLCLKSRLILLCGRYEGVDQRVADHLADEEISIGDFILSGGELAAALIVDSVSRLIPGVLGDEDSRLQESFMEGCLDYPQYTRPAEYRGLRVPEPLLSGNHQLIREWRKERAIQQTREKRPDLLTEQTDSQKERKDESPRSG